MNITSRQLQAFLLTARHGSFSRAAEQMSITQSGMSLLVKELEAQLGFRLFERTTRRVRLTGFGSRFLPIADSSLHDLEAAAARIRVSAPERRLVVGATPLIAGRLLPASIAAYGERDPRLSISLEDGKRGELAAGVIAGSLDVALGCFSEPIPETTRGSLHRFSLMAVQPEAESVRLARALGWRDLAARRLVGGPRGGEIQKRIDEQLRRVGRDAPPEMSLNFFETQIAMVEAGAGTAILPTFAIPACLGHRVTMHPLVDPVVPIDLHYVRASARELPAGGAEFIAFLGRYIAQWAQPWSARFEQAA